MSKRKKKNVNTANGNGILIIIFLMIAIIGVGTYAWLSYRTNETAMVLTIGEIENVRVTLSPYQINSKFDPVATYTSSSIVTNVEAINNNSMTKKFKLYYKVDTIEDGLNISNFKYVLTRSSSKNGSYSSITSGSFASVTSGSLVNIREESIPSGGTYYYKVYLWLDSNGDTSSASGKTFAGELRAEIVALSEQYQQVEYIQSSGTQFIDTGYYWTNENIKIFFDGKVITNSSAQSLFGNEEYTTSSGNTRNFAGIPHGTSGSYSMYLGSGSQFGVSASVGTRFTLDIVTTTDKKLSVYKNNSLVSTSTYSGTVLTKQNAYLSSNVSTNVGNIFIFANHNSNRGASNGAIQIISAMQLYRFTMYDGGVLVRDFVPCYDKYYRISEGFYKAGLCDVVNNKFYENAGSGNFTYGAVV